MMTCYVTLRRDLRGTALGVLGKIGFVHDTGQRDRETPFNHIAVTGTLDPAKWDEARRIDGVLHIAHELDDEPHATD